MNTPRLGALLILCAVGTSGCNTTASRQLALAVDTYDSRSNDAITALEAIEAKVVEEPAVSPSDRQRRFVAEAMTPGVIITQDVMAELLHPNASPPRQAKGLAEMRCQHGRFKNAFAQLESAGIFGKTAVATRAPGILDALVAQQLAMARIVQDNPEYARLQARRNAVGADTATVLASSATDEAKSDALVKLLEQSDAIEQEEDQLRAAALEDLLKAAATGIALRDQVAQYGRWSASDLIDSLTGLSGFIGEVSGDDFTKLNGRIDQLEGQIANDPALTTLVGQALASIPVPQADGTFADDTGGGQSGDSAGAAGGTPCLDSAPPELPDPDDPPAPAPQPVATPQPSPQARADAGAELGA